MPSRTHLAVCTHGATNTLNGRGANKGPLEANAAVTINPGNHHFLIHRQPVSSTIPRAIWSMGRAACAVHTQRSSARGAMSSSDRSSTSTCACMCTCVCVCVGGVCDSHRATGGHAAEQHPQGGNEGGHHLEVAHTHKRCAVARQC